MDMKPVCAVRVSLLVASRALALSLHTTLSYMAFNTGRPRFSAQGP